VEQQLLGLVWRGARIDHQNGENDDWANAVAGAVVSVLAVAKHRYAGFGWRPGEDAPAAPMSLRESLKRDPTGREAEWIFPGVSRTI